MAELYDFQRKAVANLLSGKRIIVAGCGMGKTAMGMVWAENKMKETGKKNLVVVTTASKCKAKNIEGLDDFTADAKLFCSPSFFHSLSSSLLILSWHKLAAWVTEHRKELDEYVFIFDEVQKSKAGVSSGMGRAFLKITKTNHDWAGFTGTPGDTWLSFYPYFEACEFISCKTNFLNKYAQIQTFKGYPEIVGWAREDELKDMWSRISYSPDSSKVMAELPKETHKVVTFSAPRDYKKVLKTRVNAAGEFLDTSGALVAELRRQCFTKDKQEWVKDFVDGLDSGCVMFYNYVTTGDKLEEIVSKALGKDGRIWRIDGKHHDIPTAETIGKKDVVLCQWQSGSEALNLQFLHYWVAVELCYSYSTAIQGRGRIKRIGQQHPMLFQYLLTEETIEQDIIKCLKGKSEFSETNWCISNNLIKGEK